MHGSYYQSPHHLAAAAVSLSAVWQYSEVLYDFHHRLGGEVELWIMDHCSQGLSGVWSQHERRGWCANFQHYVRDTEYFVKSVVLAGSASGGRPKVPLHLFCHSMGGLIGSHVVVANPGLFDKIVLSAPMLDVHPPAGLPAQVLRVAAFFLDRVLGACSLESRAALSHRHYSPRTQNL